MARIRTVKPEFWEDETIATLSRDARLLFLATFNMADDEGLLRWSPEYIKASAFMYDDDLQTPDVAKLMQELTDAELILSYRAGTPRRQLAWIITFRRHQKINRPQPSKLPPPSIQAGETITAYKRRDRMTCHLCGGVIPDGGDNRKLIGSLDHLVPRSQGGTDYPSNIKLSHYTCNVARRDRAPGESPSRHAPQVPDVPDSPAGSLNDSVNETLSGSPPTTPHGSLNGSLLEGNREWKGMEGNREVVARAHAVPNAPTSVAAELPDDWKPSDALLRWANATYPGLDLDFETAQFTRHWRSEGRRKKSWPDAWQKWIADSHAKRCRASPPASDRRQQATDAQFDRAMQRAQAREGAP